MDRWGLTVEKQAGVKGGQAKDREKMGSAEVKKKKKGEDVERRTRGILG